MPVIGRHTNFLMSSDYINEDGGGVEGHLHDVKDTLETHQYKTMLFGHHPSRGLFQKLKKLFLMSMSICNIADSIRLRRIINQQKSDFIRRHSISRVLGRLPLYSTK